MLLLSIIIFMTSTQISFATVDDVNSLSTVEMIRFNGYDTEVHHVVTDDGYILELHRIPRSKNGQLPTRNHAVLIHHGFFGSSADWVIGGADNSLAMQLADDSFDVWLANSRGNIYSKNHNSMSYKENAFWDFCLHEVGIYDLPAIIDYILMQTVTKQLHYVGFSFGSTVFFIMTSERPEYQSKIRSQISLAPVAYLSETKSPLRILASYSKWANSIFQILEHGMVKPQILRKSDLITNIVCKIKELQKYLCQENIIRLACGSDSESFNTKLLPAIIRHFPTSTSSKTLTHYAQFIVKDTFNQYDYGKFKNVLYYNSIVPPSYNISSIQVPITLFYGDNDKVSTPEDVMKLILQLPQLIDVIPVKNLYCHVEFLWGTNIKKRINDPVKESLRKTDNLDWIYSPRIDEMSLSIPTNFINDKDRLETNDIIVEHPTPNPLNGSKYWNILANSMSMLSNGIDYGVDYNEKVDQNPERGLQKFLFKKLMKYAKSPENYSHVWEDSTNKIPYSADDIYNQITLL